MKGWQTTTLAAWLSGNALASINVGLLAKLRYIGNVTKDRLGPRQGSNERKVTGAGMGSGCGVQRRRRRLAVVCLSIRV